jgi:tRNA (guanine37-N1)-methyltransferase
MIFNVITIFPNIFVSYFSESILKRAQEKGIIKINVHDLRKWTTDKHRTVDDTPFGGGAGMVMKIEPIYRAIVAPPLVGAPLVGALAPSTDNKIDNKIRGTHKGRPNSANSANSAKKSKIILLSAKGKKWNQQTAERYSKLDEIILICGRYEGVDERVKKFVDEEISIGDYVLTGGEIPAMAMVDSIARLLPGVLGNKESAKNESHSMKGFLEYPQYTRPEIFIVNEKKYRAPKVLLSGDHKKIEEWRRGKMKKIKK